MKVYILEGFDEGDEVVFNVCVFLELFEVEFIDMY